jgi:uncharacterized membrane protein (DUF485 family)
MSSAPLSIATSYEKILANPLYYQLIVYRRYLGVGLTIILMAFYFLAFYLVAFHPAWIITPISATSMITNGIAYCSFVIILSFVMTGIYMILAQKMDRLTSQVLGECE